MSNADLICMSPFFWVIQLIDDLDKPSPFRCALPYGLFSNKSQIHPLFSSVTDYLILAKFPLVQFRRVPKSWYYATFIKLDGPFTGALSIKWKTELLSNMIDSSSFVKFSTIDIRSWVVNWGTFFFYWLVSRT